MQNFECLKKIKKYNWPCDQVKYLDFELKTCKPDNRTNNN